MFIPTYEIRTERDHKKALARIEALWHAEPGTQEFDEFDALATLVDAYEKKHHPIADPDPIEAIRFRMEQLGLTRKDLEPLIGSRGRVSEIFERRRPLSLRMIRNLYRELHIPLEVLFAEVHTRSRRVRKNHQEVLGSSQNRPARS